MLSIILPEPTDRLLGALLFQKSNDFKVYVPADNPLLPDYEAKLPLVSGGLLEVEEPLVCFLESGALPDQDFVRRILRTERRHPGFDVYHVNLPEGKRYPRKISGAALFTGCVRGTLEAPQSTFIFRTAALRAGAVFRADGTLDPLPTVLSCAREKPVRNVWRQTLSWTAPQLSADPASQEKRIRARLDFLHWTESFYGEDDYPIGLSERMQLAARELAALYPSYPAEDLREQMASFLFAQGAIRKIRAASALKTALREREASLKVQ